MTREAKIGMLTGLFVIVLIGVLLSEYLGGSVAANNHMAPMPQLGDSYRRRAMDPVGIPGSVRPDTGSEMPKAYATDRDGNRISPVAPGTPVLASDPGMGSVTMNPTDPSGRPVQPMPAGPVLIDAGKPSVPTIQTDDGAKGQSAVYVAVGDTGPSIGGSSVGPDAALVADKSGTVRPVVKPAIKGEEYTIAKGDTLQKIARKYYKSSGKDDLRRIIAANPASLKDETSMLVVGKKLLIPAAPVSTPTAKADATTVTKLPGIDPKSVDVSKRDTVVVIHPPGVGDKADTVKKDADTTTVVSKPDKKADSPTDTYIVQKGDTLEKIAKKISPTAYKSIIDKIVTLNGMKDKDELQVGMKLKVPVKKA